MDSEFSIGFGFAWHLDLIWIGMFKEIYLDWFFKEIEESELVYGHFY
jgi:hypothetical protein